MLDERTHRRVQRPECPDDRRWAATVLSPHGVRRDAARSVVAPRGE